MIKNEDRVEIVIADKNPVVLNGLKQLFESDEHFHLVITASDGERFLQALERLDFDVGIIGWEMPFLSGNEVLKALHDNPESPKIVVYTGSPNPDIPRQVMKLGGAGFCHKSEPPQRLLDTVRQVAQGRMVFPYMDLRNEKKSPLEELTPRELDLLAAMARGLSNAELASEFQVSLNTVKFHLKNLYDKLSITSRTQAVAIYLKYVRE